MTTIKVNGKIIDRDAIESKPLTTNQRIYKENILDHYRKPRNKQLLENPSVRRHDYNQTCGDEIEVTLVIRDGKITGIGWAGDGCAISQASMSILSKKLKNMTVEDVLRLNQQYVLDLLGIPIGIVRRKCAMLGLRCAQKAIIEVKT